MELLKALFESAELPADFKEKTTTLFEAAVDERVKAEIVSLTEGFQTKLEEAKAEFVAESIKTIDEVIEEAILEWAKENAVALDSEIKGQIAESFLQNLKGVFEKADIELSGDTAGKELVKLQEQNAALQAQVEASQAALTEAQSVLTQIEIKKIIAEVTEGLADTQVDRVAKLCEAFEFKSAEDYRAKAALVVEAVTGAPLKQEARGTLAPGKEFNGSGQVKSVEIADTARGSAGSVKGTQNLDGTIAPVDGSGKVSNTVDTTAGVAGPDDGELVKKPAGASVDSAEGKTGKPESSKDLKQPGQDPATANMTFVAPGLREQMEAAAPHLNSDLVQETLKLFR